MNTKLPARRQKERRGRGRTEATCLAFHPPAAILESSRGPHLATSLRLEQQHSLYAPPPPPQNPSQAPLNFSFKTLRNVIQLCLSNSSSHYPTSTRALCALAGITSFMQDAHPAPIPEVCLPFGCHLLCGGFPDHTAKAVWRAQGLKGNCLELPLGYNVYLLSDFTSLAFNFLICRTDMMKRPNPQSHWGFIWDNTCEMLSTITGKEDKPSTCWVLLRTKARSEFLFLFTGEIVTAGLCSCSLLSLSTDDILCHLIDVSFSQLRSKSEMKCVFINKNNPNESSRLSWSKHGLPLCLWAMQ